ncbi:uroporphyrinogen-III synthase [Massilia sp. 9096]|uniref:uroporphyrinogen-III synthase n=1 Tax=Massilia sp. 9096 TaxID=1500894 RepID=UPI00056C6933|nr:uroporphyrinogen-III synthase [Massilia sp. 9096]
MNERLVVVTRPRRQAGPLADAIAALGRTAVVLPLLEIAPLPDTTLLQAALSDLARYALVAFVSPNAIEAAFAHVRAWPGATAIAVVGAASRAALAQYPVIDPATRIVSPLDPAFSDSEHLIEALEATLGLDALRARRVLVVRGDGGRELLPDALRAAGAEVETVAAYRRAVPALSPALAASLQALLARPNDWIITSSEALRGLVELAGRLETPCTVADLQHQRLIVPHSRIAETARALGFTDLTLTGSGDERLLAALQ